MESLQLKTFGKYKTLHNLSASKNSLIYRAQQNSLSSSVILKIQSSEYPSSTKIAEFRHEYAIMQILQSSHTPKALDLKKDQNRWAIVMEGIDATNNLAQLMQQEIDFESALNLAIQIAEALLEINKANIMHKDFKPNNVVYNPETQRLQLIDFGLSSLLSSEEQSLFSVEGLLGTLPYISPEQIGRMNFSVDYRTDFYSFDILLFQLSSDQLPFTADDTLGWVYSHVAKMSASLRDKNPTVSVIIEQIVNKFLSKKKEGRYQSVAVLLNDLKECRRRLQVGGSISYFEIARQGTASHFQVAQHLYGRQAELETLMNAFERVAGGQEQGEMILVAGYSGVGKSALVHETHKPHVGKGGYFIEGKFDQFKSNIPFLAIAQAYGDLIKQLLKESEERLVTWQTEILAALEGNVQVIIDIVPELVLLIGPQPPVQELGGA